MNHECLPAAGKGRSLPLRGGLYILLALFLLLFSAALLSILARRDGHRIGAAVAFGPGDFKSILIEELLPARDERPAFQVPPPPFSPGMFPCSECHRDLKTDFAPRELMMAHDEIRLTHGLGDRWCFVCHDAGPRDQLRLADGSRVDFTESHRLCGQCHGTIYRDWKAGIHGRRTGYWEGPKRYLLCAHCHDPHAPKFKPLSPLPPPARPDHPVPGRRS